MFLFHRFFMQTLILKKCYNLLLQYKEIQKTKRDAIETLKQYRGLKPGSDVFGNIIIIHNHNSYKLLLYTPNNV